MNKEKSNINQVGWVALGTLSSFALSMLSAIILSRILSKSEYGSYRQIIFIYNTLLVVFSAGLPRVFSYYLPRYSLSEGKSIVFKISKFLFISGFVFSLFLFVFSGIIAKLLNNPELATGLKYFSPVPMLLLPTLGIEGLFSTYKKTKFIAIYNTLSRVLMLVFIVLPVLLFKDDYLYAIYGWVIASFLTFFIAIYFKHIPFKKVKGIKTSLTYKEILTYSIPLLFASLGSIAMKSADQYYISRYFGNEVFAEFSNGFMELPLVGMITFSIASVLMPIFSKMVYEKKESTEIIGLWHSALMKSALIIYPLVMFFMFYSDEVIKVLYTDKYLSSAVYFRIALMLNFFNVIMFAPILLSLGETKFYSRIHVVFAFIAWIGGFIVVITLNSPIALVCFSILKSIVLTLLSFKKTADLMKISFISIFPLKKLAILFSHSLTAILIVKLLQQKFVVITNELFILAISFISFSVILVLTSGLFKLDYMKNINMLVSRIIKPKK